MNDATGLKRILIFDDDSDFRKLLLVRLGKMFANVALEEYDPVASGVPDINFDWSRYDVLLLDYYLCIHGVTGLDILRKNRKNPQFPATIMLTGAGNEEIAVRALKSGVSDYIRKEKLDKDELRMAILNAYEESKVERQRVNEATLHSHAFNKGLFYQQLEQPDEHAHQRVLLLIQLDNHEQLARAAGVIVRDNVVRHIAKQTFEVFQIGECNPSITRFSEISIALLIDDPASQKTLEFNLQGLCNHLKKRPYKFDGRKFRYTVSIGVVPIALCHASVDVIIGMAKQAVDSATDQTGENSYKIADEMQAAPAPIREQTATKTADTGVTDTDDEAHAIAAETIPEAPVEPAPTVSVDSRATAKDADDRHNEPASAPAKAEPAPPAKYKEEKAPSLAGRKPSLTQASDETILDEATLNIAALEVKRCFEEKRVVQTFQPVISLLADEDENTSEVYSASLHLIDTDGAIVPAEEIMSRVQDVPAFLKYIDRWMLREAIGRAVDSSTNQYVFLMKISDASLADTTLFNWLRELLSGLETSNPGHAIALEITEETFSSRRKQAEALMTYLRKSHGFKFMLDRIDDLETLKALTDKTRFDFLKVNREMILQLSREACGDAEEGATLLSMLKGGGAGIVVEDVEDATTLTEVISVGADYALGEFIGEPSSHLDELNNVETFEIS